MVCDFGGWLTNRTVRNQNNFDCGYHVEVMDPFTIDDLRHSVSFRLDTNFNGFLIQRQNNDRTFSRELVFIEVIVVDRPLTPGDSSVIVSNLLFWRTSNSSLYRNFTELEFLDVTLEVVGVFFFNDTRKQTFVIFRDAEELKYCIIDKVT